MAITSGSLRRSTRPGRRAAQRQRNHRGDWLAGRLRTGAGAPWPDRHRPFRSAHSSACCCSGTSPTIRPNGSSSGPSQIRRPSTASFAAKVIGEHGHHLVGLSLLQRAAPKRDRESTRGTCTAPRRRHQTRRAAISLPAHRVGRAPPSGGAPRRPRPRRRDRTSRRTPPASGRDPARLPSAGRTTTRSCRAACGADFARDGVPAVSSSSRSPR